MSYKETLFFVGECLTLQHCPDRIPRIREKIRSGDINWEELVWISSNQMVLPAVYLQFKRADLVEELPEDLIEHLVHIYTLNKKQNQEILEQTKKILQILNKHKIYPIFLKGVGNLLDGLYEDIGERMIGDIDLLVSKQDMLKAGELLISEGYTDLYGKTNPIIDELGRHYSRLIKEGEIAGVEIHFRIMISPFDKKLNFEKINKKKKKINTPDLVYVLSNDQQLIYNMMNVQMNDGGFYRGAVYLRHMYDLFLLSQINNPLKTLTEFGYYFNRLNAYLNLSAKIMGEPLSLSCKSTRQSKLFLKRFNFFITYPKISKFITVILYILFRLYNYFIQIVQAFYKSSMRHSLYRRLSDPKWYRRHLGSYKKMT